MYKPYKKNAGNKPGKKPTAKKIATQQQPELQDYFHEELAEINDAAHQLTGAWPALAKAAASPLIKNLLNGCTAANRLQLERLKTISTLLGRQETTKKCAAVKGIIATTLQLPVDAGADGAVTIAMQKLLHYLAASYAGLVMLGESLQQPASVALLKETLSELTITNTSLSTITSSAETNKLAA